MLRMHLKCWKAAVSSTALQLLCVGSFNHVPENVTLYQEVIGRRVQRGNTNLVVAFKQNRR